MSSRVCLSLLTRRRILDQNENEQATEPARGKPVFLSFVTRGVGTGEKGVHVPPLVEEGDIACICTPTWIDQMESLALLMHEIIHLHHEKQQCVVCRQWRNGNERTCVYPPLEIWVALQSMTSGFLGVFTLTQCCCKVICRLARVHCALKSQSMICLLYTSPSPRD